MIEPLLTYTIVDRLHKKVLDDYDAGNPDDVDFFTDERIDELRNTPYEHQYTPSNDHDDALDELLMNMDESDKNKTTCHVMVDVMNDDVEVGYILLDVPTPTSDDVLKQNKDHHNKAVKKVGKKYANMIHNNEYHRTSRAILTAVLKTAIRFMTIAYERNVPYPKLIDRQILESYLDTFKTEFDRQTDLLGMKSMDK